MGADAFARLSDDDLATCVHCGLCLDACPTFRITGLETESPRGRIYLMTQWKRGTLPFDEEQVKHIDLCLGCRTCEGVCPSGVPYGRIIEAGRADVEDQRRPSLKRATSRVALRQLVGHPGRLRAAGAAARVAQELHLTSVARSAACCRACARVSAPRRATSPPLSVNANIAWLFSWAV